MEATGRVKRTCVRRAAPKPSRKRGKARSRTTTRAAAAIPAAPALAGNDKVLYLMRHGITEMNEYLARDEPQSVYGSKHFRDPLLFDTVLTRKGLDGAKKAASRVSRLAPQPELLVVSPLTRALQTATAAFGAEPPCPVLVEPLFRERLYLSSDVGSPPQHLAQQWPQFEFDHLPPIWWHHDGSDDHRAVVPETDEAFGERMGRVRDWLAARPERCIAVVSHWGCLYSMTGDHFSNCELRATRLSDLLL